MSRYSPISDAALDAIAAAGFDVYQPEGGATYLHFTDGTNIGYLERDYFGGYSLTTVHIPNRQCGTGYKLDGILTDDQLTRDNLARAFMHVPGWASSADLAATRKWLDMAAFLKGRTIVPYVKARSAKQEETEA